MATLSVQSFASDLISQAVLIAVQHKYSGCHLTKVGPAFDNMFSWLGSWFEFDAACDYGKLLCVVRVRCFAKLLVHDVAQRGR